MKAFRIIGRSIRDAFRSVFRNFSLSIASIMCATITLMVVSIALLVAANTNRATTDLENELSIIVYLDKSASKEAVDYLKSSISKINGVKEVTFKSKEEAANELAKNDASFKMIFDNYEINPLLDSFVVTVDDVLKLSETTKKIEDMDYVSSANYGEKAVDTIASIFDVVEKATVVIVIALVLVTAFLITNTIKLTIYSRRNEIEIMRLVGASNTAIKMPFVVEGFVIGVLGSIIPVILTIYGYIIVFEKLNGHFISDMIKLISPYNFVFNVSFIVLGLGALIGMLGSLLAVRKYLKI